MNPAPVTAMLPAHQRVEQTLETIRRLQACDPPPAEIMVHVHEAQKTMIEALEASFPGLPILLSDENLGPGGARNRMLAAARYEIVASFDDDSHPHDPDFFARLLEWFERVPEAAILALNVFEPPAAPPDPEGSPRWVADFIGCGCAYRRTPFLAGAGYVPIPIAYSMEEADLGLRYTARNLRILYVPSLRVYHDTHLSHHASPAVAAGQVANLGLFIFLRYPVRRWPLGLLQLARKWGDTVARRRFRGALLSFPVMLRLWLTYRPYRAIVTPSSFDAHRRLRRSGGIPLRS